MSGKRAWTGLSLALAVSLLVAGCGSFGSQPKEGVLRVWITWGDDPAQIQGLFDRYAQAGGMPVEVTVGVDGDKVLTAMTGSTPPDVVVLSSGDLIKSYYKQGLVEPLNPWLEATGVDLDDIYPAPLAQCKMPDGTYLCLPWGCDIYALFWNKDLFEAAGLDPERPPQSMEELVEYADRLTLKDDKGKLTQIGFIPDFSWSHTDLYVHMFGGFWYNDDGTELTVNSQPVIDAANWQLQFYTKYGTQEVKKFVSSFGGYMSPDHGFYAGKIAMMVEGEWQVGPNFISHFRPELNYGVAPFPPPAAHPERANTAVVQGTVALIPAGVKDKEAAARLLAWMMSPEILAEEMYANSNLPTSRTAAQDPRFLQIPNFKVFMDLMADPNAKYIVTTPISLELNDALSQVEEKLLHEGGDPVPLLNEVQEEYAPKLKESLGE